ncbi:MAG: OB-fold nucleic acid binding domain-containing protein [Candidatus Bathyarchaeia archaeon]
MSPEEIIQQILAETPEVTREQVQEKLRVAREKTGGLIGETTLLRLVAAEYGVEIAHQEAKRDRKLALNHLVSGLNDVTVTGRIVAVYPVKTFEGAKSGKFASVMVMDGRGMARVVLWNEHANLVESDGLKSGQIVRFLHGYTKDDRFGTAELHLGSRSEVEVNPEDTAAEDYPKDIGGFAVKIGGISRNQRVVNVAGRVKQIFSLSKFVRQDQTEGTVMRFALADATGEIQVVAWNEKAEELEKTLRKDAKVQVLGARVKAGDNGEIEVHVDAASFVEVSAVPEQKMQISGLAEGLNRVNVEGEVASLPTSREVTTSKGEKVKVCAFELKDDGGSVWVSAWRQHAETAVALLMGEKVRLENVYVRKRFDGKLELSTRASTVMKKT